MIVAFYHYTLSKFVGNTKPSGDMTEGRNAIQGDVDNLKKWTYVNLMRNNKIKAIPDTSADWERNSLRAAQWKRQA